jgi:hypothetical protein
MQETGFTMNSIARRTKHPDRGLRAVPSIDLTDGVNLAHQFALDSDAQLHLFGGGHHSADPWKSAHQAALIGLSHLFPRLVHSVPANVVSSDQRREEGDDGKHNVVVSEAVADEEAAHAHQDHVEQSVGVSHSSGLGFDAAHELRVKLLQLEPDSECRVFRFSCSEVADA